MGNGGQPIVNDSNRIPINPCAYLDAYRPDSQQLAGKSKDLERDKYPGMLTCCSIRFQIFQPVILSYQIMKLHRHSFVCEPFTTLNHNPGSFDF